MWSARHFLASLSPMWTSTRFRAVAFLIAGGAGAITAEKLFSSTNASAAVTRFQNQHTWVARKNPDGGVVPIYAGRSCGHLLAADGGVVSDVCSLDGAEFTDAQAKSFELFLKSLGIAPPR